MSGQKFGEPLSPELQALLAHIASRLDAGAPMIKAQASAAIVVANSSTMLDIEVPETAPRIPLSDGPIPVRATVYDSAAHLVSEILVWVRAGSLIGLEQAWYTDDPPTGWPSPSSVQLS